MENRVGMILLGITVAVVCLGFSACGGSDTLVIRSPQEPSYADASEKEEKTRMSAGAQDTESVPVLSESDAPVQEPAKIYVYLCGAVREPGVYLLPEGSRIFEAVELAGGLLEEADADVVNQAQLLTDGVRVRIPYLGEEQEQGVYADDGSISSGEQDGRININTADKETLMLLPGIGTSRADAILSYREEHHGFSSPEEIMQVSGIKQGAYEKIRDRICTGR